MFFWKKNKDCLWLLLDYKVWKLELKKRKNGKSNQFSKKRFKNKKKNKLKKWLWQNIEGKKNKKTDHFAQPLDRKLLNSTIKISINSSN